MAHISDIFNFLKEYNELSNPVITEIDKQKWNLRLSQLPQIKELWSVYQSQEFENLKILEITRPIIKQCPIPDDLIINWLDPKWSRIEVSEVKYADIKVKEITKEDGSVERVEEHFMDDVKRKEAFEEWIRKRDNWRTAEMPKFQGLNLYNNFFKLYSEMKKESESVELVLGDGHIYWATNTRVIDHPVLLQKVLLEFVPEKPAFIVKCDEIKTELYTPMLRIIPTINQSMLSEIIQDVEASNYHIADISNKKGFFERIINVINDNGKYVDEFDFNYEGPMIKSEPILFLRGKTLGFSVFIDRIIEDIEINPNKNIPDFFDNLIGNRKNNEREEVIEENWNQNGIDEDILLTLPANNDQLKILKYLNKYGAVLVQGPPGTGKTHTIANLIGHLLSQGNSVLVTSHTEKALAVLKEKVYKDNEINLQDLCISLLSSNSQKKEMDVVLNEIAIKGTSLDLNESIKKIERLEKERKILINKAKVLNQELLKIRSLEYKDIVYENHTISPIDAAKFVHDGRDKYDYIPGSATDATIGLPLSINELNILYQTNQQISAEEEAILNRELPALESFWNINEFIMKADCYNRCKKELEGWNPKMPLKGTISEDDLDNLICSAEKIKSGLSDMEDYQLCSIEKILKDSMYINLWESVFIEFDALIEKYNNYRKICLENDYNIPNNIISDDNIAILDEIINCGKENPFSLKTTITKPKWEKLKRELYQNGNYINNRTYFENIKTIIQYKLQKMQVLNKVNKLISEISEKIELTFDNFEERMRYFKPKIELSISWYDNVWMKYIVRLNEFCSEPGKIGSMISIDPLNSVASIKKLINNTILPDLYKRKNLEMLNKLIEEWKQYSCFLARYKSYEQPFCELIHAVDAKDVNLNSKAYGILSSIYTKKELHIIRNQLLNKLEKFAPAWASAIKNREGIHGSCQLPENIEQSWKWRQLSSQIEQIDNYDVNEIQKEINKVNEELMRNARRLAYEKAWYEKNCNKTQAQTQAIESWRIAYRLLGKSKNKRTPLMLKSIRELMPQCQNAIPVWIMPLNHVAENFDPQKSKFDVVIIDEASQAGILALSALYLGKKLIIVGDDEQVSPEIVGIKSEEIYALVEQHLHDIPNKHILFNERTSIYHIAKACGFKPLMLTEHFRCLPEIIEFSNQLSYNGKIKPLRDASGVNTKPYVVEYRVPDAYKDSGKINKVEAEHIASLICACIEDINYKDKTIGVISLMGHEQAYEIDRLLQTHLDPKEYERRRIQCGTPAQFQGDQRDIIFLSIVEGPNEKGGTVRLLAEDGNFDITRKKYNVAASRARDQMWVVHSLNPEIDLKPDDIRLRLIRYAINPSVEWKKEKLRVAESDFEKQVMNMLLSKGYKVIPQWWVGSYRIDLVAEDGNKQIAIECDGEKYHTLENLPDDIRRQAILERLGWRFIRIRGSMFYRYPEKTMEWVYNELENYGIRSNYLGSDEKESTEHALENELIQKIKRRADEIRRSWHDEVAGDSVANKGNHDKQVQNNPDIVKVKDFIHNDSRIDNVKNTSSIKTRGIFINNFINKKEDKRRIFNEPGAKPAFDFRSNFIKSNIIKSNTEQITKNVETMETASIVKNMAEIKNKKHNQKPLFDFRKK